MLRNSLSIESLGKTAMASAKRDETVRRMADLRGRAHDIPKAGTPTTEMSLQSYMVGPVPESLPAPLLLIQALAKEEEESVCGPGDDWLFKSALPEPTRPGPPLMAHKKVIPSGTDVVTTIQHAAACFKPPPAVAGRLTARSGRPQSCPSGNLGRVSPNGAASVAQTRARNPGAGAQRPMTAEYHSSAKQRPMTPGHHSSAKQRPMTADRGAKELALGMYVHQVDQTPLVWSSDTPRSFEATPRSHRPKSAGVVALKRRSPPASASIVKRPPGARPPTAAPTYATLMSDDSPASPRRFR